MDETLEDWFLHEVLPHEAALTRYITRVWPNRSEVLDLRQETYVRVYEAAAAVRPRSPKSFLFTTARHLIVDRVRRNRVVCITTVSDADALDILVDEISPEQWVSARQEIRRLTEALDLLSPRCRSILWLRRIEDVSQREVATRMGITEGAVEKHMARGIRLLADALFGSYEPKVRPTVVMHREQASEDGKPPSD